MRRICLAIAAAVTLAGCGSGVPTSFTPDKDKYCDAYKEYEKKAGTLSQKQEESNGDEWAQADATPEQLYDGYKEEWSLEAAGLREMARYAKNQKMFDDIVSALDEIEVLLTRTKLTELVAPPGAVAEEFGSLANC